MRTARFTGRQAGSTQRTVTGGGRVGAVLLDKVERMMIQAGGNREDRRPGIRFDAAANVISRSAGEGVAR